MRLLKLLIIFSLSLLGVPSIYAAQDASFDSPLTPGTTVIAGDLDKNEFFILGNNEEAPTETKAQNVTTKPKPDVKQIAAKPKQITKPRIPRAIIQSKQQVLIQKLETAINEAQQTKQVDKPHVQLTVKKVKKVNILTINKTSPKHKVLRALPLVASAKNNNRTTVEKLRTALRKNVYKKVSQKDSYVRRFVLYNKPHFRKDHAKMKYQIIHVLHASNNTTKRKHARLASKSNISRYKHHRLND